MFIVHNRAELIAALGGTAPKIIFVSGTIPLNVDDAGQPLSCDAYAAGTGYTLEAYLVAFDPATWGRRVPSGPLETARAAAHTKRWGVGVQSQIYAENDYFVTDGAVDPSRFISRFNGTLIFIGDTLLNGHSKKSHVDVLAAYNTARDPDLSNAVTWTPFLVGEFHPTQAVAGVVRNTARTFRED